MAAQVVLVRGGRGGRGGRYCLGATPTTWPETSKTPERGPMSVAIISGLSGLFVEARVTTLSGGLAVRSGSTGTPEGPNDKGWSRRGLQTNDGAGLQVCRHHGRAGVGWQLTYKGDEGAVDKHTKR